MKITYECQFCGFRSQNKEEVERCEAQGVKSKFSVDEEVEYLSKFDKGKEQWVRATIVAVHFEERTHKIKCYNIKPGHGIPVTAHKHGPNLVFVGGSVNEEELRPLSVEQVERKEVKPILLRISGHSGASKSRLRQALENQGIQCPRAILYTSRPASKGEIHGRDYYFLSRSAIALLPEKDFLVGPVREMLQAVDLNQLETDLRFGKNELIFIEIFADLWPLLEKRLLERFGEELRRSSVFMTAIAPDYLKGLPDEKARAEHIKKEVARILKWRKREGDTPQAIQRRAESAVKEILTAIGPKGNEIYQRVFHSAPEGPDGEDEWTKEDKPIDQAAKVLREFKDFLATLKKN